MTKMLDIIEDYVNYKGYFYERLDGSCSLAKRALSIDRFQNDENVFIFLLSTRAGGVGINLTGADTVIIYDGDWNPQNDIQAQARCHRIGQTKKVNVYRLITRGCYESEMFLRASKKLALDYAILDSNLNGLNNQLSEKEIKMELQTILKKGAYYTFNDDKTEIDKFCSENIDQILDHRSHLRRDLIGGGNSKFSKVSFETGSSKIDDAEINKKDFWNKLIGIKNSSDINDDKIKRNKNIVLLSSDSSSIYSYSDDYEEDDDNGNGDVKKKSSLKTNKQDSNTYESPISFPEMEQNLIGKLALNNKNIIQSIASNIFHTCPMPFTQKASDTQALLNDYLRSIPGSNSNSNQDSNNSSDSLKPEQNKSLFIIKINETNKNKSVDHKTYENIFNCIKNHGIHGSRFFLSEFMQEIGKKLFVIAFNRLLPEERQQYLNDFNQYNLDNTTPVSQTQFLELNDKEFLTSLFKGKELEFVLEILKKDSFYKAALFVSNEKLPEKYQFAPEMDTPIGWTPIDDFILITSSPSVENISDLIEDEKLPFTKVMKDFSSLNKWILKRLEFIFNEISLIIPHDYDINEEMNGQIVPKNFGNFEKFKELNYHVVYPQKLSICLQRKLLRVFYLHGIPKENGIKKIKSILKIDSIFNDKNKDLIAIFAVKILIKAIRYKPDLCHLLKSLTYVDFTKMNDNNNVDIRWIKEEAIQSVASNLDLIFKVRENYSENVELNDLRACKWWGKKYDLILFKITAFYGFLLNSMFCKFISLNEIDDNTIESWKKEEILNLSPIKNQKMAYLVEILSFEKRKTRIVQILDFLKSHISNKE